VKNIIAGLLVVASFAVVGCSKDAPSGGQGAFANDLKGPAKTGTNDDSVKPKLSPVAPAQTARGGIPDDSVKPAPGVLPQPARGGIPDDSIKPATGPLPKPR
jgi:hypothetical protein